MTHSLVFTAIGADRTGIVSEITKLASQFGCNIDDSRMAILGSEFTLVMLLSGKKSAINQVEMRLPIIAHSLELMTIIKRTGKNHSHNICECLEVELSGPDSPGILKQVTTFFAKKNIDLSSLKSIANDHDKTVKSNILINLSDKVCKQNLAEEFQALCLQLNISGEIKKPSKQIF